MWIELTISMEGKWKEMSDKMTEAGEEVNHKMWMNLSATPWVTFRRESATISQGPALLPVTTRIPEEIEVIRRYLEANRLKS